MSEAGSGRMEVGSPDWVTVVLQDSGRMDPGPPPTAVLRGGPVIMTPGRPAGDIVLQASF